MIEQSQHLSTIGEHYKFTLSQLQSLIGQRNKFFYFSLTAVLVILAQVFTPNQANTTVLGLLATKLGLTSGINLEFVTSIVWFLLLGFVLRYFQLNINIEREYNYVHLLEADLNKLVGGIAFTREGAHYAKSETLFSRWLWVLYTIVFPSLLILAVTCRIINEARLYENSPLLWFDIVICCSIVFTTVLYFCALHVRR